jgi:cation/acetate symporter
MNIAALATFLVFLAITLVITIWASRHSASRSDFYTAGGSIGGMQNGFAFAGDYLSAGVFLGIGGLYFSAGFDGFIYNLGGVIGWPILLFLIAERLRRLGRYTLTDVLCLQLHPVPVRIFTASANLLVLIFYMVSQMVAAGALMHLLLGLSFGWSALLVGTLMTVYVVFGGMVATTWVQIIKAALLLLVAVILAFLTLLKFDFNLAGIFAVAIAKHPHHAAIMGPGSYVVGPGAALSIGLTMVCGPAGLPHILMRFFTVPNVKEARRSAYVATVIIGVFCLLMIVIGYGTIAVLTGDPAYVDAQGALNGGGNMASLYLAHALGGNVFLGAVSAVAFATILAVVSGLTLAAATTISHDLYSMLIRGGTQTEKQEIAVSRWAAFAFAAVSIALSTLFQHENVNILAAMAFSVAASATFPLLILVLFWNGLTTVGAIAGGIAGLVSALAGIYVGPSVWVGILGHATPIFPYQYPTIVSMPLAFVVAIGLSLASRRRSPSAAAARQAI